MKTTSKICSIVFAILVLTTLAVAQGAASGDLHVTVKDQKGAAVTNATVTAREQGKAAERSTNVNSNGEYRLLALSPGQYTVTVEAPGFAKAEARDVTVTVGQMADLPVTLKVAGGQEVITVSSEADLVETARSSTTDTIDQRRIDNLPINGRNYINFTLTDSQVVRDNAPSIGAAPTSGLNMSGQRARSNLVNVDGADAIDNSVNGVRSTVSQEAVQEFQIITNSYAAEYGRASGGVVNIITRSGSDEFHGDVYGYLRNRNFQAVNPFSNVSNPAYTRVQAGTAFGGPIKKGKTYYYFSYEVTRRHETGFTSIGQDNFGLVPFDATNLFAPGLAPPGTFTIQVTPDQAAFLGNPLLPPALTQPYALLAGASSGIAVNGSYPRSFGILAALGKIPVPGNGTNPLAQFPTSCNSTNLTCNGLPSAFLTLASQVGNYPIFEGTSLYSLRLDHNLSNSNRLMLRSNVSPSTVTGIQVNGENQTFGQNAYSRTSVQSYRDVAGVAQDTWTIGSNKINEFRFQYARRGLLYNFSSAPGGGDLAVSLVGVGFFGREPYSFIRRTEQRYQFTDNFSLTKGRHDIKFGVDFNYIPVDATFTVNYGGHITFGGLPSSSLGFTPIPGITIPDFSPVQAYGLGIPVTFVQGLGNPKDSFSNKPLGVFLEDAWKIKRNLTLNLGVRYDVEFAPQFAPPNALALAAYNALGIQKGIQTDTNNVQPRVGLAWDPRGNGKSVFRASYGMFYDHPLLGLYFLGDASDGSKSGQLLFFQAAPCDGTAPGSPANLNATNIFQGILGLPGCLPNAGSAFGYQLNGNAQRFDPFYANSLFLNQGYLNPSTFTPLISQLFGYPQGKNFVYAYSQQANFTFEQDLGNGFAASVAYNFNGGRHLNRPINANPVRGDLLIKNWQAAVAGGGATLSTDPLAVQGCGVGPLGPFIPAAVVSFFRPSALNPSLAPTVPALCLGLIQQVLNLEGLGLGPNGGHCDNTLPLGSSGGCVLVPFGDMDANYSNGSSVYHGLTANLRKRFGSHYQFQASYTWSHAIDDSTDLQSPLAPQDSFTTSAERSNSLFDQRHRFVFSGVYQSGKLSGAGFLSRFFSNFTVAPIVEYSSGRPFNILTGENSNFQFVSTGGRPNVVPAGTPANTCGATVSSKFSPLGAFQVPCYIDGFNGTLQSLDGNLRRNAGVTPYTVFTDLRIARRIYFGERVSLDAIADMFNVANRFNVAAVNQLWTIAGQPTAAYDPRQFQFALKINW